MAKLGDKNLQQISAIVEEFRSNTFLVGKKTRMFTFISNEKTF